MLNENNGKPKKSNPKDSADSKDEKPVKIVRRIRRTRIITKTRTYTNKKGFLSSFPFSKLIFSH